MGIRLKNKLILLSALLPTVALAEITITCKAKESVHDKRYEYDHSLLLLALEKTREKYGDYTLKFSGEMDSTRAQLAVENNYLENFIYKGTVTKKRLETLGYIPFPVDRGIVGYRVSFTNKESQEQLNTVSTLDDLKRFSILQKKGWTDVEILTYNGFDVKLGTDYEQLFHMVAQGRASLFLRGANELISEWKTHSSVKGLQYDSSMAIYYPLPRFFFTHKSNTEAIERLTEGLTTAYNDGSLLKLWENYYRESIEASNLQNRRIFKIENPLIKGIGESYKKYIYDPLDSNQTDQNKALK